MLLPFSSFLKITPLPDEPTKEKTPPVSVLTTPRPSGLKPPASSFRSTSTAGAGQRKSGLKPPGLMTRSDFLLIY